MRIIHDRRRRFVEGIGFDCNQKLELSVERHSIPALTLLSELQNHRAICSLVISTWTNLMCLSTPALLQKCPSIILWFSRNLEITHVLPRLHPHIQ